MVRGCFQYLLGFQICDLVSVRAGCWGVTKLKGPQESMPVCQEIRCGVKLNNDSRNVSCNSRYLFSVHHLTFFTKYSQINEFAFKIANEILIPFRGKNHYLVAMPTWTVPFRSYFQSFRRSIPAPDGSPSSPALLIKRRNCLARLQDKHQCFIRHALFLGQ